MPGLPGLATVALCLEFRVFGECIQGSIGILVSVYIEWSFAQTWREAQIKPGHMQVVQKGVFRTGGCVRIVRGFDGSSYYLCGEYFGKLLCDHGISWLHERHATKTSQCRTLLTTLHTLHNHIYIYIYTHMLPYTIPEHTMIVDRGI